MLRKLAGALSERYTFNMPTRAVLVCTGASAYVAYTCWQSLQAGVIPWLSGIVLGLSAALSLFCIYNVLAGGNPPKRK